jgi:hypothetical protein
MKPCNDALQLSKTGKFGPLVNLKSGYLFMKIIKNDYLISKKSWLIYFKPEKYETATSFLLKMLFLCSCSI